MTYRKRYRRRTKKTTRIFVSLILFLIFFIVNYAFPINIKDKLFNHKESIVLEKNYNLLDKIPKFSDIPYVRINDNKPFFTKEEKEIKRQEKYGELDSLNRCSSCMALVGRETMPSTPRGSIGMVRPSGWHTIKYLGIDGKFLYNRCHLIGYQLTGENANTRNLITGTRYLNVEGMLPFENRVKDYIMETNNHVLYRVVPIFKGDELVARGVTMEAYSIEDNGRGISFNVFCYNAQPGIEIDYKNGNSKAID